GIALSTPQTEIIVTFSRPPQVPEGIEGDAQPNRLRIDIALEANELTLDMNLTGPGDPCHIDPVSRTGTFGAGALPPYGEVFKGVLVDEAVTLSVRGDMVVECWRIIEPARQSGQDNRVQLE